MDLTDEEELRRQRTGSRTTAHLDIAKTAEALRVGDMPGRSHDRGIGEHGGGPPARVPAKDVISGVAGRGGYRQ